MDTYKLKKVSITQFHLFHFGKDFDGFGEAIIIVGTQ